MTVKPYEQPAMIDRKPDDKDRNKSFSPPAETARDEAVFAHVRSLLAQLQARRAKGRQG